MYIHTFACFCEPQWRFFSLLSLKYLYISFFCLSDLSLLPACCRAPLLRSPGAWPSVSLSPPSLPCLPFRLPSAPPVCCVFRGCRAVCPLSIGHAPKLSGGLPSCLLCLVVLWWLPLLVHRQAQNAMTVGADAPRIYPRPFVLLPMCCRVSRCLFRVLSCCLLPAVVWW